MVEQTEKYNGTETRGFEKSEEEMRESLLEATRREQNLGFRDRFMASGKFLQPVDALGAIAHIPNDDINTPVVDWAKQDTGPGTPSGGDQLEDQKRESGGEGGLGSDLHGEPTTEQPDSDDSRESDNSELKPDQRTQPQKTAESTQTESSEPDAVNRWGGKPEDENTVSTPSSTPDDQTPRKTDQSSTDNHRSNEAWEGGDIDSYTDTSDTGEIDTRNQTGQSSGDSENREESESEEHTPAFASGNEYDGWGDEEDSDDGSRREW